MFWNEKCLGFEHSYKLFKYFQNKDIDSNNTLQKRQNTNGSIKEQLEAKNCIPCTEKRKKVQYMKCLSSLALCPPSFSNFIMETEDNSIQRQLYNSSII